MKVDAQMCGEVPLKMCNLVSTIKPFYNVAHEQAEDGFSTIKAP